MRAERHQDNPATQNLAHAPLNAGTEHTDENPPPDTANPALVEAIEHLLAVAESLGNPALIDLRDEP